MINFFAFLSVDSVLILTYKTFSHSSKARKKMIREFMKGFIMINITKLDMR